MRLRTLQLSMLAALCGSGIASAQRPTTQDDSIAIVRAVWEAATGAHAHANSRRALWLWAPDAADSARVVPLSAPIRSALAQQGIPISPHRPAGDDTVVYRLVRWDADSAGVTVALGSAWTTILGSGARRCRARSGNGERFHLERRTAVWVVERVDPVAHGDAVCVPVP